MYFKKKRKGEKKQGREWCWGTTLVDWCDLLCTESNFSIKNSGDKISDKMSSCEYDVVSFENTIVISY